MARRLLWISASLLLAACPRSGGRSHADSDGARDPATAAEAAPPPPASTATEDAKAWLEGRLPPSVLAGPPREGGRAVIRAYYEPASLNPIAADDGLAVWIDLHLINEPLLRRDPYDDPRYRLVPALAERWEVTDGGRQQTFHLRPGVRWHDGRPLRAADVTATFEKLRAPGVKGTALRPLFELLDSVQEVDPSTVRFTWREPYFLALDAIARVPIQPAHVIGKLSASEYNEASKNPMNRSPIGTGPFRFAEWVAGEKIVLEKNPDYWGRKAYLDRVIYRIVPDHTVARELARREEIDLWDAVQPHDWAKMTDRVFRTRFHRVKYLTASYVFVGWNNRRPFFHDARVRRALAMLFDVDAFLRHVNFGIAPRATCPFYAAGPDCPKIEPIPYDPAAAAALLDEAGWRDHDDDGWRDRDGLRFSFTLMIYPQSTVSERIATFMTEAYRKAGIEVHIQKTEWSAMVKRLDEGEFDATALAWDVGPRSDPMAFWHSRAIEAGANHFGFVDPEVDRLIEAARLVRDDEARHALYRRLSRRLYALQPVLFLYVPVHLGLVHVKVRGVRPSLLWWQPQDWWLNETGGL
ncbi:MAG: hypothetical protein D6729_19785 [Deltaproteobacteria bacterium]|nr:MAG: hypothetical protein D6729_19785 [Deltaproteobacteria bacterium]